MTDLADAVLPLIRTRADLHRWSGANAHGAQMLDAVAILEQAACTDDPALVLSVIQKAIASAMKIIMRADDSSGIIGDACQRLLDLHPKVAARANPSPSKLVDRMITFQFDNGADFFTLDPVAYAPALGQKGVARYRDKLAEIADGLGPEPPEEHRWTAHTHTRFTLHRNAQRLAVLDRDSSEIIRTHARDRKVAAWYEDTAQALEEAGYIDLAIDWAQQATDFHRGHQSLKAADYWCALLAQHRPAEFLDARHEVFRRWPSASTAAKLHDAAGEDWPQLQDEVIKRLSASPRDAVLFALLTLEDTQFAWNLADQLALADNDTWSRLVKAYEKIDPLAVLPILTELVTVELTEAGAQHYRTAARRLKHMRQLTAGTDQLTSVDAFITQLRETHHRRPRLQQEFDRAGLP